jgi:tetratricopeptide (TPR) repeat protein
LAEHFQPAKIQALKRPRTNPKSGLGKKPKGGAKSAASRSPSQARKWLFRATAALLPVAVLALLELVLRLGGYGYATNFFKPMRIGAKDFLVENDAFGFRFFPQDMARTPLELRMPAKKLPGVYRIFILGESAAMGDPQPEFGAGRYLDILLRERFPQTKFEVVNTAMTAINSHAILPIARDCAGHEGDLWILYIGNNEMVGPFGAASVFGPKTPPLPMIRFYLAAQQLRAGQLALNLSRRFKSDSPVRSWAGMEMFLGSKIAPDSPARKTVYRNYERNLADILQAGLDSGAKVLLNTVPVNLRDCPPFASLHAAGVPAADCAACDTNYQAGLAAQQRNDFAGAVRDFEQAANFDAHFASLQYQWGHALLKTTNVTAAARHFQQACDDDALPFRATLQINETICDLGRRLAGPNLECFDTIGALETNTPSRILGEETFYEHVHLNLSGNYRLARNWAVEVEKLLPESLRQGVTREWPGQERCDKLLGLTDWDRYNVNSDMAARRRQPPLNSEPNNGPLLNALLEQSAQLKQRMKSVDDQKDAMGVYQEALQFWPDDYLIRANYAEFLTDIREIGPAIDQWQRVLGLYPQAYAAYYQLGRLAADQGHFDQAKQFLKTTVAMHPSFAPGWFDLGSVLAASSNYDQAITAFDQALRFNPKDSQYWFCAGLAKATDGRRAEAVEDYREAVRLDPDNWRSHFELGGLLGQDGNMTEAKTESEAAIRLNPSFPITHLNLGLALTKLGDLQGAKDQFEETLRLDPGNAGASDDLAQVQTLLADDKARQPAAKVTKTAP